MITRQAASQLAEWLVVDIEDAQALATAGPPSSQRRVLMEALRQMLATKLAPPQATKLLGIVQAILSGSYSFLDESEAIKTFSELIDYASKENSPDLRKRALTVSALVLNRVRDGLQQVPDSTLELMKSGLGPSGQADLDSLLVTMISRIDAAAQRVRETRLANRRAFDVPDLDVPQAAKNVRDDVYGDWYQDPWGWPEIEWLGDNWHRVVERLRTDATDWTVPIDVNKRGGGVRPGLVINPLDRVAFQSLVDELSVEAASHLPRWVYGWRLARQGRTKGKYEPNKEEWKVFSRGVANLCKRFQFTAHLDIDSFFRTVDTSQLLSQLGRRYRNAAVLDRLEAFLHAWHQSPNGSGIPQRSLASSVLAHAVLRPLDAFLDRKSNGGSSNTFVASRWMDDIWLHSDSETDLRSTVSEIESILAEARLSLNSDKTAIFLSTDAEQFVQLVDVYDEADTDANLTLTDLLDRTERIHEPPAFHIGLEVSKLLKSNTFTALAQISPDEFRQYSYAADRLAKAFRASGDWKRFTTTYVALARTHVSEENLSVALWAEMFPNRPEDDVRQVQTFFSEHLVDALQRVVVPLAAQRLVAWSSQFGLGKLAEVDLSAVLAFDDVFRLRGVCLALLNVAAAKEKVISAIDESDHVVAEFLEHINFEPLALSERFKTE